MRLVPTVLSLLSCLTTSHTISLSSDMRSASSVTPYCQRCQHWIVLVHGYLGNDKELGYLQDALQQEANATPHSIVVYSAISNVGITTDGIAAGGKRLAAEIMEQLPFHTNTNVTDKDTVTVTLSLVGNSLGGLYARYAIADLLQHSFIQPNIFCTTATPHLGVAKHTYIPIPTWTEWVIGNTMGTTGRDLFLHTDVIRQMATDETYLAPLRRFRHRLAYANAFGTDFQVPTSTAAFLSHSDTPHYTLDHPLDGDCTMRVQTKQQPPIQQQQQIPSEPNNQHDMAISLDGLGWTKVFWDLRQDLPFPSLWNPFSSKITLPASQPCWTSEQLLNTVGKTLTDRFYIPVGHTLMVANRKSDWYGKLNAKGKPIMDQLAKELIHQLSSTIDNSECIAAQVKQCDAIEDIQ